MNEKQSIQQFFAGRDVRGFYQNNGSKTIVVTFSKFSKSPPAALFGAKFLDDRGLSYVAYQATDNHWWHSPEMSSAAEAALPLLKGYTRIIAYGASMGASGALLFSKALGADRVIAIAPQYSILPDLVPKETRWRKEAATINHLLIDPQESVSPEAEKVIVYDPFERLDAIQARQFDGFPNVFYLRVSLAGHYPLRRMAQVGLLPDLIKILFAPELQIDEAVALVREARAKSDAYLLQFALRKYGKRHPKRALKLVSGMNLEVIADDWEVFLLLGRVFKRTGDLEKALHFAERSISISPRFKNVSFADVLLRKMNPEATDKCIASTICAFHRNRAEKTRKLLLLVERRKREALSE